MCGVYVMYVGYMSVVGVVCFHVTYACFGQCMCGTYGESVVHGVYLWCVCSVAYVSCA